MFKYSVLSACKLSTFIVKTCQLMLYIAGLWDPYETLKYTVHAERRIF
jgi:hypothetical protein